MTAYRYIPMGYYKKYKGALSSRTGFGKQVDQLLNKVKRQDARNKETTTRRSADYEKRVVAMTSICYMPEDLNDGNKSDEGDELDERLRLQQRRLATAHKDELYDDFSDYKREIFHRINAAEDKAVDFDALSYELRGLIKEIKTELAEQRSEIEAQLEEINDLKKTKEELAGEVAAHTARSDDHDYYISANCHSGTPFFKPVFSSECKYSFEN